MGKRIPASVNDQRSGVFRLMAYVCALMLGLLSLLPPMPFAVANDTNPYIKLSAFVLPDGSVPVICIDHTSSDTDGSIAPHCPICVLQDQPTTIDDNTDSVQVRIALALKAEFFNQYIPASDSYANYAPRGPPLT